MGILEQNPQQGVIVPKIAPISGRYYSARTVFGGTSTSAALSANALYAAPFTPPTNMTADRIALNIASTGTATNMRLGIYTALANGQPDALLVDSGLLAVGTIGDKEATISQALVAGVLYWLTFVADGTLTPLLNSAVTAPLGLTGPSSTTMGGAFRAFTFAALPASWGTVTAWPGAPPHICLRAV